MLFIISSYNQFVSFLQQIKESALFACHLPCPKMMSQNDGGKTGTVRKNVKTGGRSAWQVGLRKLDPGELGENWTGALLFYFLSCIFPAWLLFIAFYSEAACKQNDFT